MWTAAGEMDQRLTALVALVQDLRLVSSPHKFKNPPVLIYLAKAISYGH